MEYSVERTLFRHKAMVLGLLNPRTALPSMAMTRSFTAGQTSPIHASKRCSSSIGDRVSKTRRGFGDLVRRIGMAGALERAGSALHRHEPEELARPEPPARTPEELGPSFVKTDQHSAQGSS
ncbi:MAG: hypothetical protein AzoDbin1_05017 [Azoarcus sp.]|nr:hypothetical protein [Azoarcus sp.]